MLMLFQVCFMWKMKQTNTSVIELFGFYAFYALDTNWYWWIKLHLSVLNITTGS